MRFAALFLVFALVAAACGGNDTTDPARSTAPEGSVPAMLIASEVERAEPEAPGADVDVVAAGMQAFAADLYARLAAGNENLVYSPVSVYVALAMAYAGAGGATAVEMSAVLGDDLGGEAFHAAINVLDQALEARNREATENEGAVELSIANSLWGQEGTDFEQAFLDLLARGYGAGIRVVDFIDPDAREQARVAINEWVAGETSDRITDLIQEGILDQLVRLVLVNAVYLNAAWLTPFDEAATGDAPFQLLDGSEIDVPTMHQQGTLPYARGDGWRAVELPYAGQELAMLVILPDDGAFADVEAMFAGNLLDAIAGVLNSQQVALSLPKFEIRTQVGLVPPLQAMGLEAATSDQADFSGMTGAKDLFISDVVHEAWISADEAGTEAAAATAVIMSLTAAPMDQVDFTVDRPFLFALHDRGTGSLLFMGRVVNPGA